MEHPWPIRILSLLASVLALHSARAEPVAGQVRPGCLQERFSQDLAAPALAPKHYLVSDLLDPGAFHLPTHDYERIAARDLMHRARQGDELILTLDLVTQPYFVLRTHGRPEVLDLLEVATGKVISVSRPLLGRMMDAQGALGAGGVDLRSQFARGSVFELNRGQGPERWRVESLATALFESGQESGVRCSRADPADGEPVFAFIPPSELLKPGARMVQEGLAVLPRPIEDYHDAVSVVPAYRLSGQEKELVGRRMLAAPEVGDRFSARSLGKSVQWVVQRSERSSHGAWVTVLELGSRSGGRVRRIPYEHFVGLRPEPVVGGRRAAAFTRERVGELYRRVEDAMAKVRLRGKSLARHRQLAKATVAYLRRLGVPAVFECREASCLVLLDPESKPKDKGVPRLARFASSLSTRDRQVTFDTGLLTIEAAASYMPAYDSHPGTLIPDRHGYVILPWDELAAFFPSSYRGHELVHAVHDPKGVVLSQSTGPGASRPQYDLRLRYTQPEKRDFGMSPELYGGKTGHYVHETLAYLHEAKHHLEDAERLLAEFARTGDPRLQMAAQQALDKAEERKRWFMAFLGDDRDALRAAIQFLEVGPEALQGGVPAPERQSIELGKGMQLVYMPSEVTAFTPGSDKPWRERTATYLKAVLDGMEKDAFGSIALFDRLRQAREEAERPWSGTQSPIARLERAATPNPFFGRPLGDPHDWIPRADLKRHALALIGSGQGVSPALAEQARRSLEGRKLSAFGAFELGIPGAAPRSVHWAMEFALDSMSDPASDAELRRQLIRALGDSRYSTQTTVEGLLRPIAEGARALSAEESALAREAILRIGARGYFAPPSSGP